MVGFIMQYLHWKSYSQPSFGTRCSRKICSVSYCNSFSIIVFDGASSDNELMSEVMYHVTSHYGEDKIKSLFQDYTQHIIDLAFDEEEFPSEEEKQAEIEINKVRLESWKRTATYQNHIYNRELRSKISAM